MIRNVVVGAAVVVGIAAYSIVAAHVPGAQHERSLKSRQAEAFRAHGLEGAAALTGSYHGSAQFDELGSPTALRGVVSSSDAVVVGTIQQNSSHLTRDGNSILMAYRVSAENVLKGSMPVGSVFTLVVPGGRVGFKDGSWAQLDVPGFRRPRDGELYLLFLRSGQRYRGEVVAEGRQTWAPVFGPLGMYHLSEAAARVRASGNVKSPVAREIFKAHFNAHTFLNEVQRLLRQ